MIQKASSTPATWTAPPPDFSCLTLIVRAYIFIDCLPILLSKAFPSFFAIRQRQIGFRSAQLNQLGPSQRHSELNQLRNTPLQCIL